MFACLMCPVRYTLEDVKAGRYFPSVGVCLLCYQKMAKTHSTCFGNRKLYNPKTLPCKKECPDRVICSVFVEHPHSSMKER